MEEIDEAIGLLRELLDVVSACDMTPKLAMELMPDLADDIKRIILILAPMGG